MVGDFYHDCQWVVFITGKKERNSGPRKLIPRKSVPTLSQPYDHIYPVVWRTGRESLVHSFFLRDTPVTHLSAISKSTLIQTRAFPLTPRRMGREKENVYQGADLHLLFERKTWLWHLLFFVTWTLRKWTHLLHTSQPPLLPHYTVRFPLGNTCSNSHRESCKGLSVLLSWAAPVFASMTHFTFLIKKDGNAASVFKQQEKEVCGTSARRWERVGWGMLNKCHDQVHYLRWQSRSSQWCSCVRV